MGEALVLSIGKLSAEQATYYLDEAGGRVDVVESVGGGVEEYYGAGGGARGDWLGAASERLGLSGRVDGDALREVLAGHAVDGRPLRASSVPVRVAGFDLTFSAPKSVSVVFGLGDPTVQGEVREGHDRAVREALAYVERTAAAVRRGAGGACVEPAGGLVAAAFRHRTSRAGDPQLHTHVLVANLGQGPDGRWSALDGRRLYAQARAASFVYQAVLRSELSCRLGVEWLTVKDGIAEVAGVPKPVLRAFSRRRADIEATLRARGTCGARAAEAAALATRRAKDRNTSLDDLETQWRATARDLGFDRPQLDRVLAHRRRRRSSGELDLERVFDTMASPMGLTRKVATFGRRDVVQALCEQLPPSLPLDGGSLEAMADTFLGSSRVVPLLPGDDPEARESFRRRDGRRVPIAREEQTYSTPELLGLEHRLIETATAAQGAGAGQAAASAIERAVAARPTLSAEQRAMVERLCLSGDRISVVVGKAGTGKTFALAAAREAWQGSELPVLGVAVARRAANQLQADAGIATTSVAALLTDLDRPGGRLPDRAVLVVDEAGMLATRQLAPLLHAVEEAGGKLVLVGDHRQLPELEAGGTFRALVRRGLATELTENRRQRAAWERRALDQLRDGRAEAAVEAYAAHDRIHLAADPDGARERLVRDWHAARADGDAVMIAHRYHDVGDLNARARDRLSASGELGHVELVVAGERFAAGDAVVLKRSDPRVGVANGDRGRVVDVDIVRQRLRVQIGAAAVELEQRYLTTPTVRGDAPLAHGYAITCHVAQGLTVDRAFVLADDSPSNEWAYTALSRGRHENHLYLASRPGDPRAEYGPSSPVGRDPLERLAAAFKRSRATVTAIDRGHRDAAEDLAAAEREAARARAQRVDLEGRRWRPGRRAALADAVAREAEAERLVDRLEPANEEARHAGRPFVDDQIVARHAVAQRDRLIERQLDRGRSRGIER